LKLHKKNSKKEKSIALILSILIHGILFLILLILKVEPSPGQRSLYTILNFVEIKPEKHEVINKKKLTIQPIPYKQKNETVKTDKQKDIVKEQAVIDTAIEKTKIYKNEQIDSSYLSLKFAATLLDSFLVLHPEYGKYILQQQAKELVENKKIKQFSRLELEKRINEEMAKYLKENYPEGSEHAMSPYGGPGMQIPIDGLIDAIKKIFE
jgi:hypothetical protein